MIDITDKSRCCGCSACFSACPVGCIEMSADSEGFSYPIVDASRCIGCDRCVRVCPFLGSGDQSQPPQMATYAARSKDDELRLASSSGGMFSELCRPVIQSGGIVFGVAMDDDCRDCSFVSAETMEDLAPLRGSKYFQADAIGVYPAVLEAVRSGRRVLFCGTPCQANALSNYLGKSWPNLIIVDFVCHGVPSPSLWRANVEALENRMGRKVCMVSFRSKRDGWHHFGLESKVGDDRVFEPLDESPYLRMFLRNYCLRPSCYKCQSKTRRNSDITIGDFWGVENLLPNYNDELGCSLVVTRTHAGSVALLEVSVRIESCEVNYEDAVRFNSAERTSVVRPNKRDRFFLDLRSLSYEEMVRRYGSVQPKEIIKRIIRRVRARVGMMKV